MSRINSLDDRSKISRQDTGAVPVTSTTSITKSFIGGELGSTDVVKATGETGEQAT